MKQEKGSAALFPLIEELVSAKPSSRMIMRARRRRVSVDGIFLSFYTAVVINAEVSSQICLKFESFPEGDGPLAAPSRLSKHSTAMMQFPFLRPSDMEPYRAHGALP